MQRNLLIVILVLGALVVLSGCGPSNIALRPEFWQAKNRAIGVAVGVPPKASAYKAGSQGLLDMAISEIALNSLEKHLQSLDSSGFEDIADRFVDGLKSKGLNVKKIARPIDLEKLRKFVPASSGTYHEKDLRAIAADENIDALILLTIDRWGTVRQYYGFIPLQSPKGFCIGKGELVDLRSNSLEWSTEMSEEEGSVDVEGDWDTPPDFRAVDAAIGTAVKRAKFYVETDFFKPGSFPSYQGSVASVGPGVYNRSSASFSIKYGFFSPNDQLRSDWTNYSIVGTSVRAEEGSFGGLGMAGRVLFRTSLLDSRLRIGGEYSMQILASEPTGSTVEWSYGGIPVGSSSLDREFIGHSIQAVGDVKIAGFSSLDLYGSVGLGVLFFSGEKTRYSIDPASYSSPYFIMPEETNSLPMEMAGSIRFYAAIPVARMLTIDPGIRFFQSFGNEEISVVQLSAGISYLW